MINKIFIYIEIEIIINNNKILKIKFTLIYSNYYETNSSEVNFLIFKLHTNIYLFFI